MSRHFCPSSSSPDSFLIESIKGIQDGKEIFAPLHYVYILVCRDGTFYTGYTNHLQSRLNTHNAGRGAKYTRSRRPVYLVYHEVFLNKHDALSREYFLKKLTRSQKLQLILGRCFCLKDMNLQSAADALFEEENPKH